MSVTDQKKVDQKKVDQKKVLVSLTPQGIGICPNRNIHLEF